jgi:antitoxin component YwqK of YwqJK toxin-antitoxin module
MKQKTQILILIFPLFVFAQPNQIRTIDYKGLTYFIFPKYQKKDHNLSGAYWIEKEKKNKEPIITPFPKDGDWIQFFQEDSTKAVLIFQIKNGLPDGKYQRFDFDGKLVENGNFEAGSRIGEWHINDRDEDISGNYIKIDSAYYKSAWEPYYYNLHKGKDGLWIYQNKQGTILKKEFYKNKKRDSTWVIYYPNGQKKVEKNYHNDYLNGIYKAWGEDGKLLIEQNFKDGKKSGQSTEWHPDGKLKCELVYQQDKIVSGNCVLYYKTGEKYAEGQLDDDVKVGVWIYYHKNGNIWAKGTYVPFITSICVSAAARDYYHSAMNGKWTFWNSNGQQIAQGNYQPAQIKTPRGYFFEGEKLNNWKYWDEHKMEVKEKKFPFLSLLNLDLE